MRSTIPIILLVALSFVACSDKKQSSPPSELYAYNDNIKPRWSSFENSTAEKGKGGMENNGAKGHPSDAIDAGETKVLLDVQGQGVINRMWITIIDRSPEMLRSLKLEMFWDGESKPAVSVPFGDFFNVGLGQTAVFDNIFFANPEGRSFNCFIPMPFKKGARIQITNESKNRLSHIFYDVNFQTLKNWDDSYMYFHAFWSRDTATTLSEDFELLPHVDGRGRFLGVNIGINANPAYKDYWWGEGEVKMYLDGDKDFPTLIGTGSEDYIGTAWGQGKFFNDYSGCLIAGENRQWAFYRFHVPDPVFFETDCKVTMQQIGGNRKEKVIELINEGVPLIPVGFDDTKHTVRPLYKKDSVVDLSDPSFPEGFVNFYRSDDVSATSYFYLSSPVNSLPSLQSLNIRTARLDLRGKQN